MNVTLHYNNGLLELKDEAGKILIFSLAHVDGVTRSWSGWWFRARGDWIEVGDITTSKCRDVSLKELIEEGSIYLGSPTLTWFQISLLVALVGIHFVVFIGVL